MVCSEKAESLKYLDSKGYIYIYIYTDIYWGLKRGASLSLSLSLYIYIYVCICFEAGMR